MEEKQERKRSVLAEVFRMIDQIFRSQEISMKFVNFGFSFNEDSEEFEQGSSI